MFHSESLAFLIEFRTSKYFQPQCYFTLQRQLKFKKNAFKESSNSSKKDTFDSQFKNLKINHTNSRLDSDLQDLVFQHKWEKYQVLPHRWGNILIFNSSWQLKNTYHSWNKDTHKKIPEGCYDNGLIFITVGLYFKPFIRLLKFLNMLLKAYIFERQKKNKKRK